MNEEEEKMCAVGKNPVLACPWAKAKDLFIVHLLPLPKNFWDDDEDVFMQLMMRMYMQLCLLTILPPHN